MTLVSIEYHVLLHLSDPIGCIVVFLYPVGHALIHHGEEEVPALCHTCYTVF